MIYQQYDQPPNLLLLNMNSSKQYNFEIHLNSFQDAQEVTEIAIKIKDYSLWIYNYLNKFIEDICNFPNFSKLNLTINQGSKLQQQDAIKIGEWIQNFNMVNSISIRINTDNNTFANEAKLVIQDLKKLKQLQSLSLTIEENSIGNQVISEVVECISNISSLQQLKLEVFSNKIGKFGAQQIGIALYQLYMLKDLTLTIGNNNDIGFGPDENINLDNLCNIIYFLIDFNNQFFKLSTQLPIYLITSQHFLKIVDQVFTFQINIKIQHVNLIIHGLNNPQHTLKLLNINFQIIQTYGIDSIARGFQNLNGLTQLSLTIDNDNKLNTLGCERLGEGLKNLCNLQKLKLIIGHNDIQADGAVGICNGINYLTNLTHLELTFKYANSIISVGAIAIGNTIQNLKNLTYLHINIDSGNNIGQNGAIGIGNGLKSLNKLVNLTIIVSWKNYIRDEGVLGIAEGLSELKNLMSLHLEFDITNNITTIGSNAIEDQIIKFKKLKELRLIYDQLNKKKIFRKIIRLVNFKS